MAGMDYVRAAQPRIVALFLVTVLAAMLLCGSPAAWRVLVVLAATAFTVGGAALLNNVIERDVDQGHGAHAPARHGHRPHLAGAGDGSGRHPRRGRWAAACWAVAGGLAALFALLGAAYYVFVYTLLLKPRTALSAVPGGVAGVFPALIGWAATGAPWSGFILFLCVLIPVWSPPHSWALTLALGDDYRASGIPTPPARYGDAATRRLIAAFVLGLTVVLAAPLGAGLFGPVYAAGVSLAAVLLWTFTVRLLRRPSTAAAWALFKNSRVRASRSCWPPLSPTRSSERRRRPVLGPCPAAAPATVPSTPTGEPSLARARRSAARPSAAAPMRTCSTRRNVGCDQSYSTAKTSLAPATRSTVRKVTKPAARAVRIGCWPGSWSTLWKAPSCVITQSIHGTRNSGVKMSPGRITAGQNTAGSRKPPYLDVPAGEQAHRALEPSHVPVRLGGRGRVHALSGP